MGCFNVKILINGHDAGDFLVDTGATHTLVPERLLKEFGVTPNGTRHLLTANGMITCPIGLAEIAIPSLNKSFPCPVLFGNDDTLRLLGATTLENLELAVDPCATKLVETTTLLL